MKKLYPIRTAENVAAAEHLSDEEKELAIKNLKRIPPTTPYCLLQNDPELAAMWRLTEMYVTELLKPDFQMIPFSDMNLITLVTAKHSGCEAQISLFAAYTGVALYGFGKGTDAAAKLALLDFPEAAAWTKEESLCIRFVNALLDYKMTDELFSEALELWGEKKTLRHITWANLVNFWCMFAVCTDATFDPATVPPMGLISPKLVENAISYGPEKEGILAVWNNTKNIVK